METIDGLDRPVCPVELSVCLYFYLLVGMELFVKSVEEGELNSKYLYSKVCSVFREDQIISIVNFL